MSVKLTKNSKHWKWYRTHSLWVPPRNDIKPRPIRAHTRHIHYLPKWYRGKVRVPKNRPKYWHTTHRGDILLVDRTVRSGGKSIRR